MFLESRTTALPLSGPHATTLANYVRLLDISGDFNRSCIAAARYPPPMPNLRTIRLCAGVSPRLAVINGIVWRGITWLRPHSLVIRDRTGVPNVFRVPGGQTPSLLKFGTPVASVLKVGEFVSVLDKGLSFNDSTLPFLCEGMPVPTLESFTVVFWTKSRNEPWEWSAHNCDARLRDTGWGPMFQKLVLLLLRQPASEGRPLLTIVNAGAIPDLGGIGRASAGGISPADVTSEQRAMRFEIALKGMFNHICDQYEAGRRWWAAGEWHWHASTRDKQHHIRFLTMDEFLAEDNGDSFDEDELVGWRPAQ